MAKLALTFVSAALALHGTLAQVVIGFHGTNNNTAAIWQQQGNIARPPGSGGGESGADAELGPGLYVTDDPIIALAFANNNAQVNPGTTPRVCAISAISTPVWNTAVQKVFLPQNQQDIALIGDSATPAIKQRFENRRTRYINLVLPGVQASTTVRFSLFNAREGNGQLVLAPQIQELFRADCFVYNGGNLPGGFVGFPTFAYNSAATRTAWNIAPENLPAARTATAAFP
ncbi:hypothetical protein CVT26_011739 [Gymnopilus dilepis]|uniref:SGNH hydrolase-type esterase domain-containing protein n=1 Tax=Gymnopilus dilepis TaxID=231916 RepID=A0A409W5U7_9AGAR|nr:hypothetical protein CVT26_011739 [Gymnopilus dilepis]